MNGTSAQNASFNVSGSGTIGGALDVRGPMIRRIARAHGNGPGDGTDNGAIGSRILTFTKTRDATGIHVGYEDNLRVLNINSACAWEIRFNGVACPNPGPISFHQYEGGVTSGIHGGSSDDHRGKANFGTCFGLPAGIYVVQVYVANTVGSQPAGDCFTGWYNQYWALEAEEVY